MTAKKLGGPDALYRHTPEAKAERKRQERAAIEAMKKSLTTQAQQPVPGHPQKDKK